MVTQLAFLAVLLATAHAWPIKRQDSSTSTVSAPTDLPSGGVSSSDMGPTPTATITASSTGAPAPTATYAFSCGEGYDLTYSIERREYAGVALTDAVGVVSNWTGTSDASDPGATRSQVVQGVTFNDTLVSSTTNATNNFLEQIWTTGPVDATPLGVNLTVSNATQNLQFYTNSTTNATTAQWFINFCASDQAVGYEFAPTLINQGLDAFTIQFGNLTSPGPSGSASVPIPTVTATDTGMVTTFAAGPTPTDTVSASVLTSAGPTAV